MKSIFDKVSIQCSKLTTKAYSTSFSLGIYFLNSKLHYPIYSIYGFVRFADEIVDSFEGYHQSHLLEQFKTETFEAIKNGISLNPILNAFQQVVNKYSIDQKLIETFLKSMEMDLIRKEHSVETYKEYILGSAEVVGLMCLHVFIENDKKLFDDLRPYAMKLGAAFQKVNFLRDLKADFKVLGRSYFPNLDFNNLSSQDKTRIEEEIQLDFNEALQGIKKLPTTSKGGVYLAYMYYNTLFKKIKRSSAQNISEKRIRISNGKKVLIMLNSVFHYKLDLI